MLDAPAKASGNTAGRMEREPFALMWELDQPEDEFKTPPESPFHLSCESLDTGRMKNAMGPPASNRKRTFPETAHQPQSRKMSREKSISAGVLGSSPSSTQMKAIDPHKSSLPIPSAGLNTGSLYRAQSTDSLRSLATSGVSGPISTSMSVWRSANTSANTSFDASTAATSFNCSGEPAELDGHAMLGSRISDVCEPDLLLNGDFRSHLKIDPDPVEFNREASMKAKALPMGPSQQKLSRVSQFLRQLIFESPFGIRNFRLRNL